MNPKTKHPGGGLHRALWGGLQPGPEGRVRTLTCPLDGPQWAHSCLQVVSFCTIYGSLRLSFQVPDDKEGGQDRLALQQRAGASTYPLGKPVRKGDQKKGICTMEQNALRNGHVAVVDTLLTAGVPVDATDHKGLTPLMMACMFGRSMMSAYLLGKVSC